MKEKKQYQKPQVSQVQLTLQNPVLSLCNSVAPTVAQAPQTCNFLSANCSAISIVP
jgi:hypothetical protein